LPVMHVQANALDAVASIAAAPLKSENAVRKAPRAPTCTFSTPAPLASHRRVAQLSGALGGQVCKPARRGRFTDLTPIRRAARSTGRRGPRGGPAGSS